MRASVHTYEIECDDPQVAILLADYLCQMKNIIKIQKYQNIVTISTFNKELIHNYIEDFFTARPHLLRQITSKCRNC